MGDKVLAYNAATGQTGEYSITAVISHTDEVITDLTIDGEEIETTPQHPFYTQERGWVYAGDLQVGEHIRTADWDYGKVESVKNVQQTQSMYNLTVDEAHTFFVGDGQWLVHNDVPCIHIPIEEGRDYVFNTQDEAYEAALKAHSLDPAQIPDEIVPQYESRYGTQANLVGDRGQPAERLLFLDQNGDIADVGHHRWGHLFEDITPNQYSSPHYHGPGDYGHYYYLTTRQGISADTWEQVKALRQMLNLP